MKGWKKWLQICSVMLICVMVMAGGKINAEAHSYSSDYRKWSQGGSDDQGVREVGCWIVAQAKLLYEANVDRSSSFNPDVYFNWQVNNGCLVNPWGGNYNQTNGGTAPVKYAQQKGKNLEYLGYWNASDDQLWFNINAGYYTILYVSGTNTGGSHYVMIANDYSKATGQLYCYDSFTDRGHVEMQRITRYSVHNGGYVYKANNPVHTHSYASSVTTNPTCDKTGVRTYRCSCGHSYTESIAASGHSYTAKVVDPTTSKQGYTLYTCKKCSSSYKGNYTSALVQKNGWYECTALPSYVTSDKYVIEYNNISEKIQSTSPGAGWTNAGVVKNEWQNTGSEYTVHYDMPISDARVLVSSIYYHYCGPSTNGYSNYEMSGNYIHYDWISASAVRSEYKGDDNGFPYFYLYRGDGSLLYCNSNETCDGSWGTHGARGCTWYKQNIYQDRVKVVLNKYTKESGWTTAKNSSASSVRYRYKAKQGSAANELTTGSVVENVSNGNFVVTVSGKSVAYAGPVTAKKTVTIPAKIVVNGKTYEVTSIAKNAFKNDKKVQTVKIGKNIKTISAGAFQNCTKLKSVSIGSAVTRIEAKAFYKCSSLTKITIPAKVKFIGKHAFYGCKKLKNITIKSSVLLKGTIHKQAFSGVHKKVVVKVPKKSYKLAKQVLRKKGMPSKAVYKKN